MGSRKCNYSYSQCPLSWAKIWGLSEFKALLSPQGVISHLCGIVADKTPYVPACIVFLNPLLHASVCTWDLQILGKASTPCLQSIPVVAWPFPLILCFHLRMQPGSDICGPLSQYPKIYTPLCNPRGNFSGVSDLHRFLKSKSIPLSWVYWVLANNKHNSKSYACIISCISLNLYYNPVN